MVARAREAEISGYKAMVERKEKVSKLKAK